MCGSLIWWQVPKISILLDVANLRQNFLKMVVRLAGIEPTTLGFGGQYSIH